MPLLYLTSHSSRFCFLFQVHDGPTYFCHVTGIGVNPGLDFSFEKYNFGACFIYRAGMPITTTELVIKNKDSKEIR